MNPIDDLFRDGLQGRSGEVPGDLWSRIQAGKTPAAPEGAKVDQFFANKLAERTGEVPADMWSRIVTTAVAAGAVVDQTFAEGLEDHTADVPAGMWEWVWSSVVATKPPAVFRRRWLVAVAGLLFLLIGGGVWWLLQPKTPVASEAPTDRVVALTIAPTASKELPADEALALQEDEELAADTADETPSQSDIEMPPLTGQGTARPSISPAQVGGKQVQAAAVSTVELVVDVSRKLQDSEAASGSIDQEKLDDLTNVEATSLTTAGNKPARVVPAALPSLPSAAAIATLPLVNAPSIELKRHTRIQNRKQGSFRAAPRHRFQTELLFGASYARQEFTALTPDQEFLRTLRQNSEFPELSYQITLRGSYKLSDRLLLLGGLTYAEIRNEFENDPIINGQQTLITTTNRIRQLEAPLLLGFRLPGDRLSVSLNAGPLVNLTTSVQGRFFHPDSVQPRDLAVDGNYRRNTGLGFMTSLSTTYKIGKKEPFLLLIEPYFKAYPSSFTAKSAPLKEKYWVAGLQLGVRKGF